MNTRNLSRLSLVFILVILIGTGSSVYALTQMHVYLPIVVHISSPTPSIITPQLQGGYYEAKMPNNSQLSFTVAEGFIGPAKDIGQAKDVGFLFKVIPSFCPWAAFSFGGQFEPIINGNFSFIAYDAQTNEILASVSCQSISSRKATCNIHRYLGPGWGYCDDIEGVATRQ